jgi:hypothetical protein
VLLGKVRFKNIFISHSPDSKLIHPLVHLSSPFGHIFFPKYLALLAPAFCVDNQRPPWINNCQGRHPAAGSPTSSPGSIAGSDQICLILLIKLRTKIPLGGIFLSSRPVSLAASSSLHWHLSNGSRLSISLLLRMPRYEIAYWVKLPLLIHVFSALRNSAQSGF